MCHAKPTTGADTSRVGTYCPNVCAIGVARPIFRRRAAENVRVAISGKYEEQLVVDACFPSAVPEVQGPNCEHTSSGARARSEIQGAGVQSWRVGGVQRSQRGNHVDPVASGCGSEDDGGCHGGACTVRNLSWRLLLRNEALLHAESSEMTIVWSRAGQQENRAYMKWPAMRLSSDPGVGVGIMVVCR